MENPKILSRVSAMLILFHFSKIIHSGNIPNDNFRTSSVKEVPWFEEQRIPNFTLVNSVTTSANERGRRISYSNPKLETLNRLRNRLSQEKLFSNFADDYIKKKTFIPNDQDNEIMQRLSGKSENVSWETTVSNEMENTIINITTKEETTDQLDKYYSSWFHLRTILENMKSIIYNQYVSTSSEKPSLELSVIDSIIKVGNSLNFFYEILNNVNNHLVTFIYSKWEELKRFFESLSNFKNIIKY
ncbi:UNVERIFIED_CONTAM: hypothetical protein RMT77_017168 [Armadillidium vulgare]